MVLGSDTWLWDIHPHALPVAERGLGSDYCGIGARVITLWDVLLTIPKLSP